MNTRKREKELYKSDIQMTSYPVFCGIDFIYNDAHTTGCKVYHGGSANVIEITHCREGRMECAFGTQLFYLTPGDLVIRKKVSEDCSYFFPQSHYHGLTVLVDLERAPRCLSCFLEDVVVDLAALQTKYCPTGAPYIVRSNTSITHIFSELYTIPPEIRQGYFKVKALELLLFLSGTELGTDEIDARCISWEQITLAKSVCDHLAVHMDQRETIPQLAQRFHVSQTALKNSFKQVYGISVYAHLREQKMRVAARLLCSTNQTVLEIAGRCGYDNASKFAKAFRGVCGMAPAEYRMQNRDWLTESKPSLNP